MPHFNRWAGSGAISDDIVEGRWCILDAVSEMGVLRERGDTGCSV